MEKKLSQVLNRSDSACIYYLFAGFVGYRARQTRFRDPIRFDVTHYSRGRTRRTRERQIISAARVYDLNTHTAVTAACLF